MLNNFQILKAAFHFQSRINHTYLPELLLQLLFLFIVCNLSSRELKFQPP